VDQSLRQTQVGSTEGVKIPLGLWEGSTENATLARTLLADLVDRGLDPEQAILFVIDGGKALRRAIKDVFGEHALVHRCHRHKERNVTDLLPERERSTILAKMRGAWALSDPDLAKHGSSSSLRSSIDPGPMPRARVRLLSGRSLIKHTSALASRYARTLGRDRRTLAVLLGQAPLIALLICVLYPAHLLAVPDRQPTRSAQFIFLLVTAALWLGLIDSCREIVRDARSSCVSWG
jgi:Transposase, Mutator family